MTESKEFKDFKNMLEKVSGRQETVFARDLIISLKKIEDKSELLKSFKKGGKDTSLLHLALEHMEQEFLVIRCMLYVLHMDKSITSEKIKKAINQGNTSVLDVANKKGVTENADETTQSSTVHRSGGAPIKISAQVREKKSNTVTKSLLKILRDDNPGEAAGESLPNTYKQQINLHEVAARGNKTEQ